MNQKRKQKRNPRRNKLAFDTVVGYLRDFNSISVNAVVWSDSGRASKNPAKPSPADFRCDVMKAVQKKIPKDITLKKFFMAYVLYDSDDCIEREMHAQRVIGDRRHSLEQRCGEEFFKRGIYPVQAKGYFHSIRKEKAALRD